MLVLVGMLSDLGMHEASFGFDSLTKHLPKLISGARPTFALQSRETRRGKVAKHLEESESQVHLRRGYGNLGGES